MDYLVAGDIGCYSLGALPPLEAMDTLVCMGAAIGVGLGMRHALPPVEAARVVSIIGDSTFMHSGITGLVEMAYNPPPSGHVVLILDNGTTAMTGRQEHPGTGRRLDHVPTNKIDLEGLCLSLGMNVETIDPVAQPEQLQQALRQALADNGLHVLIVRRPCILAAGDIKKYEQQAKAVAAEPVAQQCECNCECKEG
jgi:indolepyruvate ferredoxin oxidoreductase alpha subunit